MFTASNEEMQTVFDNCDFIAEAANYSQYGISDREEIADDVRECLKEYNADENDVQEYTDRIMLALNA